MPYYTAGKYTGRIVNQVLTENRAGNPELQLVFLPTASIDAHGQADSITTDFPRTIYLTLTERTIGTPEKPGWVLLTLQFLGFNGTSFSQLDPDSDNPCSFIGMEVELRCNIETYEGKDREKWSVIRPGAGTIAKPAAKKTIRALDAKFSKLLKARTANPPSQPATTQLAPTAQTDAALLGNEDIPF